MDIEYDYNYDYEYDKIFMKSVEQNERKFVHC